eukprot:TRINITY_DN10599_c0_g1_i10.p1 TRINITY_DN10599_c0_g1~~TRINITY_DN10599_c0_g1_i10.p1  ORF type:complete len:117 (-),score=33.00 TRINITY_DN10599_c0_g1_i10:149-499(-)
MLCYYHFNLMRKGLTTHEDCKYTYEGNQASPFTRFSYFANLSRTIFRKFGKKLFDPELMYKEPEGSVRNEPAGTARVLSSTDAPERREKPADGEPLSQKQIKITIKNDICRSSMHY